MLAIDYGRRKLGLAVSDELGWTAQPLVTLERRSRHEDFARLAQLVRQHDVGQIVVGYPLNLNGQPGPMAREAAKFARRLEAALDLPVALVDERLTSWVAERWRAEHRRRATRRRDDEIAAALLLEDFLARQQTAE